MLRKIQIFPKNAAQNTGDFVAQNTDLYQNCFAKYRKELLRLLCAFYRCCAKYNKPPKSSIPITMRIWSTDTVGHQVTLFHSAPGCG